MVSRRLILKLGIFKGTSFLTVSCILVSFLVYLLLSLLMGTLRPSGIIIAVLAPALIAPFPFATLLRILVSLDRAQGELLRMQSDLEMRVMEATQDLKNANLQLKREIEERIKTELDLRELSRKNEEALDVARMGFWEFDAAARLFTFNDQCYSLLGITPIEARGYTMTAEEFLTYCHPEDVHLLRENIEKAITSDDAGFQHHVDVRVLRGDGRIGYTTAWFRVEKDSEGKAVKLHGISQDITDRKLADESLRESEALYRTLIETSPDPIVMYTPDGKLLTVSPQAAKTYGVSDVEKFLAEVKTVFDLIPEDTKSMAEANYQRTLSDGYAQKHEYQVRLRDGRLIPMEVNSSVVKDSNGEPKAVISILRDTTNRQRSEQIMIIQRDLWLALARSTSFQNAMQLCLDASIRATGFDAAGIYLLDPKSEIFRLACVRGTSDWFASRVNQYAPESQRAQLIMKGDPLYFEGDDIASVENRDDIWQEGIKSVAIIPIRSQDAIIGSLNIASRACDAIPDYCRGVLESIASRIGATFSRIQTEEALRESESKFKDLAEKSHVGVYMLQDGLFKYVNAEFANILGYRIDEMIDRIGPPGVIFPEDLPVVEENIRRRIAGELKSLRYDFRIVTKDGKTRHAEVYSSQTFYQGQPAIIGTLLDITDRRAAEEELRRLSFAIEQAAENIIITDADGVIQYVNPAFEKITGYSRVEAIGQTPRLLKSGVHEAAFYERIWNTIKEGEIWSGRITNRRKDGKLIQEDATICPLLTSKGDMTGYVALKRDVTDAVALEMQLRQAQKMEAIGTLAGGIAHDFNNILGAMIGFAELAKFKTKDAKIAPYLEQILKACDRSRDLVKQILTFSRKREQEKKPVSVTPIIKEALKLLRSSIPATVEIRQSFDTEQDVVQADPTQIHQVLMNLCTNAVHAMRNREGILEVHLGQVNSAKIPVLDPDMKRGQYIQLAVRDTGEGIDPAIKDKIFDPFFTTKASGEGTGLGLSVVYGIVKDHGGTIFVESEKGKGTAFTVYLPLIDSGQELKPHPIENIPLGKGRVLYVDDEEMLAFLMREMLTSIGYDVTVRLSARDALEAFRANPGRFDVVITDMTMPNMTGAALAKELWQIRPDLPIILTTGFSERMNEEEAKKIGIQEFLMKPVSLTALAETLKKILETDTREVAASNG